VYIQIVKKNYKENGFSLDSYVKEFHLFTTSEHFTGMHCSFREKTPLIVRFICMQQHIQKYTDY